MEGDDMMEMAMDLRLKFSCKVGPLLFDFWNIQTCGQFTASLIVITVLCFLRHLLQMHKTRFILSLPSDIPLDEKANSLLRQSCCGTYQSVEEERTKLAPDRFTKNLPSPVNGAPPIKEVVLTRNLRISLPTRLFLTLYFSILGGASIIIMLLAMSFNVGVILAILIGEGAGHFYFSTDFYHDLLQSGSFH